MVNFVITDNAVPNSQFDIVLWLFHVYPRMNINIESIMCCSISKTNLHYERDYFYKWYAVHNTSIIINELDFTLLRAVQCSLYVLL